MPDPTVDFLIIGGAKCATTWLQNSLQQSAGIVMPDPELHYFSRGYDKGPDWYRAQFPDAPPGARVGEKSNSYLTEPRAAERIRADLPDAKLIVQMRDPVERAYSDYCMLYRRGHVSADIQRYLDPDVAASGRFISDGCYGAHIARFRDLFPEERFLFLLYERTIADPASQLARLARHIGHAAPLSEPLSARVKDKTAAHVPGPLRKVLRPLRPLLDPIRNTAPLQAVRSAVARPFVYPPLPPLLRAKLTEFYARDRELLVRMTGLELSDWAGVPAPSAA